MNKINNDRRKFIKDATKVGTLASVGFVPISKVLAGKEESFPDVAGQHSFLTPPYLQTLTPNSVDIMFVTAKRAYSWVEFGEQDLTDKAHSLEDGFVIAFNRINCISLANLKPNTSYKYKVFSKEIVLFKPYDLQYGVTIESEEFSFKTPSVEEEEVRCVIFNDIHDRPYSFGELMQQNEDRPFDFVLLNGDMFDYEEDEAQIINNLLTPCTDLFAKSKPFYLLRGNHETRGKFRAELKDYFSYPEGQYYFNLNWGPVHFTFLDTGEDKPDGADVYGGIVEFDSFREEQALWLEKEMQKPAYVNAKYKVVFMHIPTHHSGDWHGTMHCRKLFTPLFEKYKVDLVISGHTHRYGIHLPSEEHSYPIAIGGGPKTGNRTITNLMANKDKLELRMIDDSGKQVGEYVIKSF